MIEASNIDHTDDKYIDHEIDRIRKELKDLHCNKIKTIIIVLHPFQESRISHVSLALIKIYFKLFANPEFWFHVGIVFSHSYEIFPQEELEKIKNEKKNKLIPQFIDYAEKISNEINKELPKEKKIIVPQVFQTFFTDCGEVVPPYTHERTDKEIDRLLTWSRSLRTMELA